MGSEYGMEKSNVLEAQTAINTRTVVTGMGVLTAAGDSPETFFHAIINGKSGIKKISSFDVSACRVSMGAEIETDAVLISDKLSKLAGRLAFCIDQALSQARLTRGNLREYTTALVLGTFLGEIGFARQNEEFAAHGFDSVAQELLITLNITGPYFILANACASGVHAIGLARDLLRDNEADIVIVGGYEGLGEFVFAGMDRIRSLDNAVRPFDAGRNGAVLGEGTGILILEKEETARIRGAEIKADILGYGLTNDTYHCFRPDPEGKGVAAAIRMALRDSSLPPQSIGYICAHGTGTRMNDKMETIAIKEVFGPYAGQIPVSSIKSITGHTLGASGILSAIAAILALNKDYLPPTINYENPDPECDLDYIPRQGRARQISTALCHAFGFGGVNGVLALGKNATTGSDCCFEPNAGFSINDGIAECWDQKFEDEYELLKTLNKLIHEFIKQTDLSKLPGEEIGIVMDVGAGLFPAQEKFWMEICQKSARLASPILFSYTFPSRIAGDIAQEQGFQGPCLTICQNDNTLDKAIWLAQGMLRQKKARRMLTCKLGETYFLALLISAGADYITLKHARFYITELLDKYQGDGRAQGVAIVLQRSITHEISG